MSKVKLVGHFGIVAGAYGNVLGFWRLLRDTIRGRRRTYSICAHVPETRELRDVYLTNELGAVLY